MAMIPNTLALNIPFGSAGMVPRENRLLAHPIDLIDANGVTFEDDHCRKEAGATLYDTMRGAISYNADITPARKWDEVMRMFTGTTIPTAPVSLGVTNYTATAANLSLVLPGPTLAIGTLVFIAIATDSDTAGANWSCADTAGNTYTRDSASFATALLTTHVFFSVITTALVATNTITVTVSVGVPAIAMVGMATIGATGIANFDTYTSTGSNVAVTAIPLSPSSSYLTFPTLTFAAIGTLGPDTDTYTQAPLWTTPIRKGTAITINLAAYLATTLNGQVNQLFDWWDTPTSQHLITATNTGEIYKEVGGNVDAIQLRRQLTGGAVAPKFVQSLSPGTGAVSRQFFFFNGFDPPQVAVGNPGALSMAAISAAPADWLVAGKGPVSGIIHQGRLWGFGNANQPHTLYVSLPANHQDFTATPQIFSADSSLGDRVWSAAEFQGVLYVFKYPRGILFLDDSDVTITNWSMKTKSEGLGCAPTPHAVLPMDDDVLFMAADGQFHLLSAVQTLGGTRVSSLSYALGLSKWIREHLDLTALNRTLSVWHAQKKIAYFYVPSVAGGGLVYTLKFDFGAIQTGGPTRFSYSLRDGVTGAALRRDTDTILKPIFAETEKIYLTEREARVKGAADGYTGSFQTPHHDCSSVETSAAVGSPDLGTKNKIFEHLELTFAPVSAGELTVEVYVDFVLRETLTYDATQLSERKRLHVGDGNTISLKVTNSTADEDFKLLGATVWFKAGVEDNSR